ncbi:MAG: hypothetical protein WCJ94_05985 [bacterium]
MAKKIVKTKAIKNRLIEKNPINRKVNKNTYDYKKDLFMRFMYFLSVFAAVAVVTYIIFTLNGAMPPNQDEKYTIDLNKAKLEQAKTVSGDITMLTNSEAALAITAEEIKPSFESRLNEIAPGKKFNMIYLMGGFPRSFRLLLEKADYKCINSNGTLLVMITPMELNRNGRFFTGAIYSFFGWKELFTELIPYMQFNYVADFLGYFVFPFSTYSEKVKNIFSSDISRGDNSSASQLSKYVTQHFYQYALSDYQSDSLVKIIKGCQKRGLKVIIVKMPTSVELRKVLGIGNLNRFSSRVNQIAKNNKVPVIDYITGVNGSEYDYPDTAHLGPVSRQKFVDKLMIDLKPLLN